MLNIELRKSANFFLLLSIILGEKIQITFFYCFRDAQIMREKQAKKAADAAAAAKA